MEDWEELRREFDRVSTFPDFDPSQRIWWIYLRAAVEKWLERNEEPGVRAAFDRIKGFPEDLPDERARWLELRDAVGAALESSSDASSQP